MFFFKFFFSKPIKEIELVRIQRQIKMIKNPMYKNSTINLPNYIV